MLEFGVTLRLLADMIRFIRLTIVSVLLCGWNVSSAQDAAGREFKVELTELTPRALKKAMTENVKGYRIGIALSGGGARGFAHLGVLEELEKSGVQIDVVAGTSMGGIIGGLYATGMPLKEIEKTALGISWTEFFSDRPKRGTVLFTRRAETESDLLTVRFEGHTPRIPTALSSGQQLVNVLTSLTLTSTYFTGGDFANLDRKLAVVATDIVSGQEVVFERGSLVDALRATMGVPLAFTPLQLDGKLLMDGGLLEPIPTRTCRLLGADFVIAVDATSDLLPVNEIVDPIDIANQTTSILSSETKRQLLSEANFVFIPEMKPIKATNFGLGDSAIVDGRRAVASRLLELRRRLAAVADSSAIVHVDSVEFVDSAGERGDTSLQQAPANLLRLRGQTLRTTQINRAVYEVFQSGSFQEVDYHLEDGVLKVRAAGFPLIRKLKIEGNEIYTDLTLLHAAAFPETGINSIDQLQSVYDNILTHYHQNGYDLAQISDARYDPNTEELSIVLDEGRISGVSIEGNTKTRWWVVTSYFPLDAGDFYSKYKAMRGVQDIFASGLFDNVNLRLEERAGGAWITISVKEKPFTFVRVAARYHEEFHPEAFLKVGYANLAGTGNELSFNTRFSERRKLYQLQLRADRIFRSFITYNFRLYYANDKVGQFAGATRLPDRTDKRWGVKLGVGQQLWRRGLLDITARYEAVRYQYEGQSNDVERRVASVQVSVNVDTKDRYTFPRSGRVLKGTLEVAGDVLSTDEVYRKFEGAAQIYLPMAAKLNLHPGVSVGWSELGLPIYDKFYLGGSRSFYGYTTDQLVGDKYFLSSLEIRVGPVYNLYLSARYDAGQVFGRFEEVRLQGLRHAFGLMLALDTPLGPMSVAYGRAENKFDKLYLNLGYDF